MILEPVPRKYATYVLEDYMAVFAKRLTDEQVNLLLQKKEANNPLFLCVGK